MPPPGLSPFERSLCLVANVRPGEGRSIGLMVAQVYLLLLAYYLIRPVREALILAEGTAVVRSYAVGAVALTLIFLIPLYQLLYDRLDGHGTKATVLRWVTAFFIANLLLFCALGAAGIPIALPFFVWVGVFSVMLLAQFWAFATDLFNIRSGERLFAVIAVGSALGAWSGSQMSGLLFPLIGAYGLMLAAALLLACVIWLSARVQASVPPGSQAIDGVTPPPPAPGIDELLAGFNMILRSRYLLLIAVFVTLINWINSTGGYILASFIETHAERAVAAGGTATERELIGGFYSDYFAWITLLQLLLQMLVVSRVLKYLGVGVALLVLPLVMAANYGLMVWMPVFALVRMGMIVENSVSYSLHGTACTSLFLPLTRSQKYVGKTTIDTFFWRFGDLLHALMIYASTQLWVLPLTTIMLINLGLALVAFAVAVVIGRLHRRAARMHPDNLDEIPAPSLHDVPVGSVGSRH